MLPCIRSVGPGQQIPSSDDLLRASLDDGALHHAWWGTGWAYIRGGATNRRFSGSLAGSAKMSLRPAAAIVFQSSSSSCLSGFSTGLGPLVCLENKEYYKNARY